jgi:GntR family transcriptional regulator, arabinose operon transcriptional repressor
MPSTKDLKPVQPQPGKPLYLVAKDRIRQAIDAGVFGPGEQMPSTKELSEQLEVSLVTAHRALQELVNAGILQRSQGKGTFVHQAYLEGRRTIGESRVGLVFQRDASLGDFHHGQILEGIRQAAHEHNVDLILLRYDDDVRKECDGFVYVNPLPSELQGIAARHKNPTVVIGARADSPAVCSIDVDNVQLARQAAAHLLGLGHTSLAYVGGTDEIGNNRDRWAGFVAGLSEKQIPPRPQWALKHAGWRMDDREEQDLARMLTGPSRPTAIFAAGLFDALDVYAAARSAGLKIGEDLSVVAVDDPPSAPFLSPPLTTMRQPLLEIGRGAVEALVERFRKEDVPPQNRLLRAELVVRASTVPPPRR